MRLLPWHVAAALVWGVGCRTEETPDTGTPRDTSVEGDTADTGGDTGEDTGETGDTAPAPCTVNRFAPVGTGHALPAWEGVSYTRAWGGETRDGAWRLVRIEGKPAVMLLRADAIEDIGTTRWVAHPLAEGGFAATGVDWTLPEGWVAPEDGVDATDPALMALPVGIEPAVPSVLGEAVAGTPWLVDLDANGWPDLVTYDATGWSVYAGSAGGLAAAVRWTFPEGAPVASFDGRTDTEPDDGLDWRVLDMDGDARPDLLVQRAAGDATIGTSRWIVHPNTGTGFGEAVAWTLPPVEGASPGVVPFLADVDGDGRPDLVSPPAARTGGPGEAPGARAWRVHRNTGSGFGTAEDWALPEGYPEGTFARLTAPADADLAWMLRDLTGDGVPDLVVVRDAREERAADAVGTAIWVVHPGAARADGTKGAGFTGEAISFVLPTGLPEGALASAGDTSDASPAWALLDLDTDGRLDLVVTEWRGATDEGVGETQWRVWKGECAE